MGLSQRIGRTLAAYDPVVARRGWGLVVAASVVVALVSLASNVTTVSQLSGGADTALAVRSTISKVVNSGVVWGGLPILAGWLVRRLGQAVAAGIAACLVALFVHYGIGRLFGLFDSTVWTENQFWFGIAVLVGGPLGLIGAVARRNDLGGLLARLVVPVAAIVEPFFLGMFNTPAILPWANRVSSVVSAVVLIAAGTAGAAAILARHRTRQSAPTRGTSDLTVDTHHRGCD